METVIIESVCKRFRQRADALPGLFGRRRPGATIALNTVSLRAEAGEVLVILGPNGSGKTTLFKIISTMLLADSGRVAVGRTDSVTNPRELQRKVGFAIVSERSFFPRLTARENLDLFASLEDVPRRRRPSAIEEVLEITGLSDHADALAQTFSSGMFQRLAISRALLKSPSVLLLDEPTRSLDPETAERLWCFIRERLVQHSTVLVASHSFQEAISVGTRAAMLAGGEVVAERNLQHKIGIEELREFYFEHLHQTRIAEESVHLGGK